ncbi:Glycerol kinase [Anatilimnocola aggregata]|uniref:Glycerol kinase n=1 Tax=Anatilimnocola aggregata TaxID=2528021 RepID=A0A517Y5C8_9BACT|nr:glycerol kinase GlpK [Anatilimnocola aggregata]QDU25451.1 Glycerol kinase [Anatilimnocola aggregata]
MPHILALDQGTTSCRAIVFNHAGEIQAVAQQEFEQHFPKPGWVEHDAHEIWSTQIGVATEVVARASLRPSDIVAIGITNQRETTVLWDRETGHPIHHAIVWQDRRTAPLCDQLQAAGNADLIQERTGLLLDAYFSATKIAWLLDNVPGARAKAEAGKLAFGTIDTWLVWNLTGGAQHITDITNASRTMLLNIHTGEWDEELLKLFNIPRSLLPEVRSSSEIYGETTGGLLNARGIPIAGIAGDQQAALFGQLCLEPGQTKTTYGTGCFMLKSTGTKPLISKNRLLSTIACRRNNQTTYALEGSVFIGGAVVQWLRDGLEIIRKSSEVSQLAASVPDNGGVFLVPAFAGLGAPHWDPAARGLMIGLTRGTTKAHIARAAVESIAFQVADLLSAMQADSENDLTEMRVDGGASKDDLLMQFQADLLGVPLVRPKEIETTALGAAYLAGLAVGFWQGTDELVHLQQIDRRYEPKMPRSKVDALRGEWQRAVERCKLWEGGSR